MSEKSKRKKAKQLELKRQRTALEAPRTEPNLAGGTDRVFRCTWPTDHPALSQQYTECIESLDLTAIGATKERHGDKYVLRLPPPYFYLTIEHGEIVSIEKALLVHEAAMQLGAILRMRAQ